MSTPRSCDRTRSPGNWSPRPCRCAPSQLAAASPGRGLAEPLTAAELRILKLLPTSTYLQIADTLYISRNTVKVHLRSVYQKLGVASRAQALERAVDLSLL